MDVLTNMEATNRRWLLSTSSMVGVTEFCGLLLVIAGTAGLLCWALQPCRRALSLVLALLFPAAYLHRRPPQPPTQPRCLSSGTPLPPIDHFFTCKDHFLGESPPTQAIPTQRTDCRRYLLPGPEEKAGIHFTSLPFLFPSSSSPSITPPCSLNMSSSFHRHGSKPRSIQWT